MITLEKVNEKNIWKLVRLKVREEQNDFVATNTESILEAYCAVTAGQVALPFGIYSAGEPVGFVMLGFGRGSGDDEPEAADGNYCIWRLMIDGAHQGQGLGGAALDAALEYIRSWPCGRAESCWLSYEPENTGAKALYYSRGFRENGEVCGDETVAVLKL